MCSNPIPNLYFISDGNFGSPLFCRRERIVMMTEMIERDIESVPKIVESEVNHVTKKTRVEIDTVTGATEIDIRTARGTTGMV